jgi:glycosyltransferase involved in cell wall biosynthesis
VNTSSHDRSERKSAGKKLRVLMLVENNFPSDIRVWNEAHTLSQAGYLVTVIALRTRGEKFHEEVNGVQVYRVPTLTVFKKLGEAQGTLGRILGMFQALVGYFLEYVYFTVACFLLSLYVACWKGVDVVHAHNPPDTLFVVGAFHRLLGKRFVFDHHDLSPELYLGRFGMKQGEGGIIYKTLLTLEKLSLRVANIAIATNESYKEAQCQRGKMAKDKVFIVRNGPDLRRIKMVPADPRLLAMGKSILCYIGTMNPQDGVDYMLRALHHLAFTLGKKDFYCVVIGTGDSFEHLKQMADILGLQDYAWFTGFVSDEDLVRYLSTADICLDPNPSNPLNDVSTWIKVMEYMAVGKPVVSFDLKETRVTAQDAAVYVEPNDDLAFAKQIAFLMDRPELRKKMGEFGKRRVEKELAWDVVSQNLLRAYTRMIKDHQ